MNIGDRIKARRIELNLTQDELAKKAGYKSRSSINKLENSRTLPSSKIEKMAEALETTPAHLMGWDLEEFVEVYRQISDGLEEKKNPGSTTQSFSMFGSSDMYHPFPVTDDEKDMILKYRETTEQYQQVIMGVVMNAPKKDGQSSSHSRSEGIA